MGSVPFSHSDSLQPHRLQHTRLPCPSPPPGAYWNSCPSCWWCHPTISSYVIRFSSIFPSIKVFFNESVLHIRWPKYWSFSFSISPSNEYSGLISFQMDWFILYSMGIFSVYIFHGFSSVAQSCPTLCDPMNCSLPGLPVHHQLLEFTQTHVMV